MKRQTLLAQTRVLIFFALIAAVLLSTSLFTKFGANAQMQSDVENPRSDQQLSAEDKARLNDALKKNAATLKFVKNAGQWAPEILYGISSQVGNVFVESDKLVFENVRRTSNEPADGESTGRKGSGGDLESHTFAVRFDGGNSNPAVEPGEAFTTKYNYFHETDERNWKSNVEAYKEITLRDVYPGVSLRLYSQDDNKLEYDWIISPGADFRSIKLLVEGSDGVAVAGDGSLDVGLHFGSSHFSSPRAYQVTPDGEKEVAFSFVKTADDQVGFDTGASIDPQYPLVIDPTFVAGTWFDQNSSSFDAYLFATAVDTATGNIYCAGYVNVTDTAGYLPAGGYDTSYNGSFDAVVYVLSPDLKTLVYVTYYGGAGSDEAYGLSLSANNVFIVGEGAALPTAGTPFDSTNNGGQDGFVAVFPKNLSSLTYASYLGSAGADAVYTVRALSDTSYVLSGIVNGALSTTAPNYLLNSADATQSVQEGYIAKFGTLNTLTFGTYVGGTGNEFVNDSQVMADGRIAFTGYTSSSASFPAEVNSQAAVGTGITGFVGTIPSGGGSFQYLDLIGGDGGDWLNSLAVDGDTLYWTGSSQSTNFPGVAGSYDSTYSGANATPPGGSVPFGDLIVGKVTVPASGVPSGYQATYYGCTSGCGAGDGTTGVVIRVMAPSCSASKYLVIFGAHMQSGAAGVAARVPMQNIGSEPLYNPTFQGTVDMLISVFTTDLTTLPFSTLAGGAQSDYFGQTGVAKGANHITVSGDTFYLGTTSHSASTGAGAIVPNLIGDVNGSQAAGSVFDPNRSPAVGTTIDAHIIFALNFLGFDFGDAPLSYGTATAKHTVGCVQTSSSGNLRLGPTVDMEAVGNPANGAGATLDNTTGGNDEDGLSSIAPLSTGMTSYNPGPITVLNNTGSNATLNGWVDFNRNGTFDAGELKSVVVPTSVATQTVNLNWTGLSGLVAGQSYIRLRLSTTAPSPLATGPASNGEVEDYPVTISVPTAAGVSIEGRVTTADGSGIRNVQLTLAEWDGTVHTATTGPFGYYRFTDIPAGQTVVMSIASKRFAFKRSSRLVTINDSLADFDWIASQ
jgi:hypothetical protein